jgi:hypothetical protein
LSKGLDSRPEADISFHERNEGRQIEDGVARKMMGLEFIEVKEAPE